MAFVSKDEVPDLEFDFSHHGGPVGTMPEPTQEMVLNWQNEMNQGAVNAGLDLPANASAIDVAKAVLAKDRVKLSRDSLDAFARLGGAVEVANPSKAKGAPAKVWKGGSPTHAQLDALPFRVQRGWFGYVSGMLTNPESKPGATTS